MKGSLFFLVLAILGSALASYPPIEQRVQELLAKMTVSDMVGQMLHPWSASDGKNADNLEKLAQTYGGVGAAYQFWVSNGCPGGREASVTCVAQAINNIQTYMKKNTTLGIPISIVMETLHGGGSYATVFPMPITMGASWNTSLVHEIGTVIGKEARALGVDRGFSPELNLPDPRLGRTEENYGEDPMLVAQIGVAMATGMQGDTLGPMQYLADPSNHITCEAKHAVAYGYYGLDAGPADIGPTALYDVYLKPWRSYAKTGGRGVMLAHNSVDSVPNHANGPMISTLESFGLAGGLFASDDGDIPALQDDHIAANLSQAGILAATAGVNQELNINAYPTLIESVNNGLMDKSVLEKAAGNVLRQKFAAGLFDDNWEVNATYALSILDGPEHRYLARRTAREGLVMLKNDGNILPLDASKLSTVAVVGPNGGCPNNDSCGAIANQLGGYTQGGTATVTVLEAAQTALAHATVSFSQGADIDDLDESKIEAAVALATKSDVVIAVVGDSSDGYGHGSCAEGTDRDSLDLPGSQLPLLDALATATNNGTNPPMIVVLINGRPATFGEGRWSRFAGLIDRLPVVLVAGRPGEEGGSGIMDVVLGDYNPSGRLAQTWPRTVGQVHQFTPWFIKFRTPTRPYSEGVPSTPMFPFGHGLSYTNVTTSDLTLSPATVKPGDTFNVTVSLSSTGPAVDHVVQVYFNQDVAQLVRYSKMLLAFTKVHLPADSKNVQVTLTINSNDMEYWYPPASQYILDDGSYNIYVGDNCADSHSLQATLQIQS